MLFARLHKKSLLDKEIQCVMEIISQIPPDKHEYTIIASNLDRLYKIRSESKKNRINRDLVLMIIGNILYILVVMYHEEGHVFTTKALGWIMKWRI
jgi:hypothetical protein